MPHLRIPLRVVFYRDEGVWVAHCLEFDLMGDGATQAEALRNLEEAMTLQIEASLKSGNRANLFKPAAGRFFEMFAAGTDVAHGEVHIESEAVTIDDLSAREYSGDLVCT
jgi:predicted RNase H-like HicB family nuclease